MNILKLILPFFLASGFYVLATEYSLPYEQMNLIDAVDCATDSAHAFTEYPSGISTVETVLGQQVRSLSNTSGDMKYFAYQLGKGCGLEANKGYVLRIRYPQDQPRTMFILNRGCETSRGFHTGHTLGDGLNTPYVNSNSESLELPLSGEYESWDMLFYLQERFPALKQPRSEEFPRDQVPTNGFWVLCLQLSPDNDPLSAGVAISRIELYEAPTVDVLTQHIEELPAGLPRRHLFWREEMADSVVSSEDPLARGFEDDLTWYEHKFELMQFLGIKTFAKDLLEFSSNQGWDSTKYGGSSWTYNSHWPRRWSKIVRRCGELGLEVLPYYEYAGSKGSGALSLGYQKRARPLSISPNYTHISWSETANVDVTDPDTFEDFRRMLEITVVDEQEFCDFAGIWMRTRVSDIPISFGDAALARFDSETGSTGTTRTELSNNTDLYESYLSWWYQKRHDFLVAVRTYLNSHMPEDLVVLYTADSSESGKSLLPQYACDVIAEDPTAWADIPDLTVNPLSQALSENWQLETLTSPWNTWSYWEWQHAVPHPDPACYTNTPGIFQTMTMNRAYTLDPEALSAFHAKDGLAVVRHYCLNEDATVVSGDNRLTGYFVADVDYAGPFVVLPEALAFAHGNPFYIGYLASNNFNRGNPEYVRRFNANFLSLPALPSEIVSYGGDSSNIVVRRIDTPKNGTYLGVVNIGRQPEQVTLRLPEAGTLLNAVTGEHLGPATNQVALSLDPCELRALHFFAASSNHPPEICVDTRMNVEWFSCLNTHGSFAMTDVIPKLTDYDEGDGITSVLWKATGALKSNVVIQTPFAKSTKIAFLQAGTYEVMLSVDDGKATNEVPITFQVAPRTHQIIITSNMVDYTGSSVVDSGLFDQQEECGTPPFRDAPGDWTYAPGAVSYPVEFTVDLQQPYTLSQIWLYDYNSSGLFEVLAQETASSNWTPIVEYTTSLYKTWVVHEVDCTTQHLKFRKGSGGIVSEVILYGKGDGLEYTPLIDSSPVALSISTPAGSHAALLTFPARPLQTYRLNRSSNLLDWVQGEPFDEKTPFPLQSVPAQEAKAFFRLSVANP